jgi:hypothetical protein
VKKKYLIGILIFIPFLQILLLPFANKIEPVIFGLPFLQFWLFLWIAVTPLCTWAIFRIQKKQGGLE